MSFGERSREMLTLNAARAGLLVVFVAAWELASGRLVDAFWVSSPSAVFSYLRDGLLDGPLVSHTMVTLQEVVLGLVPGIIFGVLLGVLLAEIRWLGRMLDPLLLALNGIPRVALGPLLIVWFGIGMTSKVFLAFSLVLFVVLFNTYAGIQNVDQSYVRIGRALGASRLQLFQKVTLPATTPWFFAGVKIAIPYALVGALVGEFIASNEGLGYLVQYNANLYNATASIAIIFYLALLTMVLNEIANVLYRWMWRAPTQAAATTTAAA